MANEEQLALLKQGRDVWNRWRRENPGTAIDLSGAYLFEIVLMKVDLSEANLSGANLSGANLSFADFSLAKLVNANLSRADLIKTNFRYANLSRAKVGRARLISSNLSEANLSGTNFSRANLCRTSLFKANLGFADLSEANLSEANLSKANLSEANLSKANLNKADLSEANLNETKFISADLSEADLSDTNLCLADLSDTKLSRANLRRTSLFNAKLSSTELSEADLSGAKLDKTDLSRANLSRANLSGTNLSEADLSEANLSEADLSGADLSGADLSEGNLSGANLFRANLSFAYFINANLRKAKLSESQVLYANFTQAILTGVCIADWQIGSSTILEGVKCDYIFRTYDVETGEFTGRLPVDPDSTFAPSEFTQRFQIIASALETIDITFTDGIDWQAFFQSFQDIRRQRPDQDISIQGMERKGQAFIVRLEVEADVDKAAIETQIKQLYANQLAALEAQYEKQLKLQGVHLEDARHTIEKERQEKATLMGIMATMAENQGPKYDMRGTQFAGGFAETVNGNQIGGIINNYGQNTDDILCLLTSLRDLSQTFPDEQKIEAEMELDALEADLNKPEPPEPKRLGKHIKRLIAAGTAAATIAGGAVTFSDNINQFTDNAFELGEKLGLTREDIQN